MSKTKINLTEIETTCQTFKFDDSPELLHITKTGFKDKYMIVYEDAYEQMLGKVEFGSHSEVEKWFNIKIN